MENKLIITNNKETITSLELVKQINIFRKQEGNRAELQHKTLLEIIRDEFSEEINEQKILPVEYKDKKGEKRPMYNLTYNQAKQILVRESKFVRRAIIHYIEKLEEQIKLKPTDSKKEKILLELQKPLETMKTIFGIKNFDNISYEKLLEIKEALDNYNEEKEKVIIEANMIFGDLLNNKKSLVKEEDYLELIKKYIEIKPMNLFLLKLSSQY